MVLESIEMMDKKTIKFDTSYFIIYAFNKLYLKLLIIVLLAILKI